MAGRKRTSSARRKARVVAATAPPVRMSLEASVHYVLGVAERPMSLRAVTARVATVGPVASLSDVERVLISRPDQYARMGAVPPKWFLIQAE